MMTDLFGQKDDILEQQIRCVEREIGMRQRVYPNWINAKKISAGKAEYEVQMMQEVLKSLKELAKVKQQLAIAVEALKKYADKDRWTDVDTPFGYYEKAHYWKEKNPQADSIHGYDGFDEAEQALQQIKELGK